MKSLYFALGICFFGLGAVGTVVPGLPTTPFMLLALWAFSRSSERFHNWLYNHPFFGPPLQRWRDERIIPQRAKVLAIAVMIFSLVYLVFFTALSVWIKVVVFLVMSYGAWFILSQPSVKQSENKTA